MIFLGVEWDVLADAFPFQSTKKGVIIGSIITGDCKDLLKL
jgi:hypothetical protein